jgi:peptide/nickel transport system permease protein
MTTYIIKRMLQAIVVIVGVMMGTFFLLQLTGDPARAMLPLEADPEAVEQMRDKLGLDEPLPMQFARYMMRAVQGDFGDSLSHKHIPAREIVFSRLPATLHLAVTVWVASITFSLFLGIIAALNRGRWLDNISMVIAMLGQCIPSFWLGLMLILLFAVGLHWLPTSGRDGMSVRYLILPALTLSAPFTARMTRVVRSSMLEVLGKDYVRTAHAKGLARRVVVLRHALRNVAIPLVTLFAMDFGSLLSGSIITETIFGWPGVGLLANDAIVMRDFPVVQTIVFYVATGFVLINLGVDILYAALDPRVRLGGEA